MSIIIHILVIIRWVLGEHDLGFDTTERESQRVEREVKYKKKSLRQLAKELGISQSYLSQIKSGKRPISQKVISKLKEIDKQKTGGSVWESNPPKTLHMPPDGFEVREAHRDPNAPPLVLTGSSNLSRFSAAIGYLR